MHGDGETLLHTAQRLGGRPPDAGDRAVIRAAHAADLAQVLQQLGPLERTALFRSLERDQAGEVLSELDDHTLLELVRDLEDVELSRILDQMPAEHAADVVDELPIEQAEKVLDLMEEQHSEDVQGILEYPEQSAGRLMSADFVAVPETATVEEAINRIRRSITQERAFDLYVVNGDRRLVGVVALHRLLIADPRSPLSSLADEVMNVRPEVDREDVARLVTKYDLVSLPVVDGQGHLLGVISVDDVLDIVEAEASEDIFRIAGSDAAELERRTPFQVAMLRLPWVLTTLLIELGAGWVIHYFDQTLAQVILLASFMPVIQAISGNTGLQSVTMVVRGLATGQVQLARWWEPLRRQGQTSIILGVVCGAVVGTVGLLWHSAVFGLVVAVSMFISVNLSGIAGTVIPMLSKRLGFDPALTAGPFETAFQDVIGVTIFLSLATALLHWLV
jgi:magnesium transporter